MKYDYLIVGSGFFGAICAYELKKLGYTVCVIDRRSHIGGNCYTEEKNEIPIQMYGPQVFHTSNTEVWNWINQFSEFNNYRHTAIALGNGKFYSLPVNMWTFYQFYGTAYPMHVNSDVITRQNIQIPKNLEEVFLKNVGESIYNCIIKDYIEKAFGKPAKDLPAESINEFPAKMMYDGYFYDDKYEGMPINGYTSIFRKLLDGIDVRLNTDYFDGNFPDHNNLIYTGPIDRFFNYKHGRLLYRGFEYKHKLLGHSNHQGVGVVYFCTKNASYTRVIENKHFYCKNTSNTWMTWEYPVEFYDDKTEVMQLLTEESNSVCQLYKNESKNSKTIFGGKLATLKRMNVAQTIESALNYIKSVLPK